jgi:hypothetical protein
MVSPSFKRSTLASSPIPSSTTLSDMNFSSQERGMQTEGIPWNIDPNTKISEHRETTSLVRGWPGNQNYPISIFIQILTMSNFTKCILLRDLIVVNNVRGKFAVSESGQFGRADPEESKLRKFSC